MTIEELPLYVSTKKLCALIDLTRQRIDALQKDPASGFPEPIRIGRSVRHCVADVLEWMKAHGKLAKDTAVLKNHTRKINPVSDFARKSLHCEPPHLEQVDPVSAPRAALIEKRFLINGRSFSFAKPSTKSKISDLRPIQVEVRIKDKLSGSYLASLRTSNNQDGPPCLADASQIARVTTEQPSDLVPISQTNRPFRPPSPDQLKSDYESGLTLDELCIRYRMGKSRVSQILRQADTSMRRPGRTPLTTRSRTPP